MKKKVVRPADRQTALIQRRRMKMAKSKHTELWGYTSKFYEWLES